jgi:hypothetical protein
VCGTQWRITRVCDIPSQRVYLLLAPFTPDFLPSTCSLFIRLFRSLHPPSLPPLSLQLLGQLEHLSLRVTLLTLSSLIIRICYPHCPSLIIPSQLLGQLEHLSLRVTLLTLTSLIFRICYPHCPSLLTPSQLLGQLEQLGRQHDRDVRSAPSDQRQASRCRSTRPHGLHRPEEGNGWQSCVGVRGPSRRAFIRPSCS